MAEAAFRIHQPTTEFRRPHINNRWGFPMPNKNPDRFRSRGCKIKSWRCPTFTWGNPTLSSALSVFTSEFEMGSGGSRTLLPPGKLILKTWECIDVSCRFEDMHPSRHANRLGVI